MKTSRALKLAVSRHQQLAAAVSSSPASEPVPKQAQAAWLMPRGCS